jgi:hypothetical protein
MLHAHRIATPGQLGGWPWVGTMPRPTLSRVLASEDGPGRHLSSALALPQQFQFNDTIGPRSYTSVLGQTRGMSGMRTATTLAGIAAAALLASVAGVHGQTPCQATIMNPCPPPKPRPDSAASSSKTDPNKSDQVQNGLRRGLSVAPDTTLGLTPRGLGLNSKF